MNTYANIFTYVYICIYSLNNGVVCVEGHGETQLNTTEMWTPMNGISKGQLPKTQNEQTEQVISIINLYTVYTPEIQHGT